VHAGYHLTFMGFLSWVGQLNMDGCHYYNILYEDMLCDVILLRFT